MNWSPCETLNYPLKTEFFNLQIMERNTTDIALSASRYVDARDKKRQKFPVNLIFLDVYTDSNCRVLLSVLIK